MKTFIERLESVNEYLGKIVAWIGVVLLFVVVYEVISRKLFGAPTSWAFELSTMLYGAMFILGAGYTLRHKMHISIDVISSSRTRKTQAILNIIGYLLFFLPFMIIAIYATSKFALQAWQGLEHSQSPWGPPLYHFKTLMPIGFALLSLQGIAEFAKAIKALREERAEGGNQ